MKKATKEKPKWYVKQDYIARHDWLDKFLDDDFRFGINCFIDNDEPIKLFMEFNHLGAEIKIITDESISLVLPKEPSNREEVLVQLITMRTKPTEAAYLKKTDQIRLTWS